MASRTDRRNVANSLESAGFTFPFDVSDLIDKALTTPGITDRVAYAKALIYKSQRFKNYYPGIFRPNGTLKMNPAEYENYVTSSQNAASSAGFSLTRKQAGLLIKRNVSADEYAFRIRVGTEAKASKDLIRGVNEVLKARGMPTLTGPNAVEKIFDFFAGRSNSSTYDIYEEAALIAAAAGAGINISRAQANRLGQTAQGVTSYEDAAKGFADISEQKKFAGSELKSFGLTDSDLQEIAFNGPQAEQKRQKLAQALKQREATLKGNVATQQTGLSKQGRPITQSSIEAGY